MKRTLFVLFGVLIGFLFGEVLRRKKMERLQALKVKAARRKEINELWEARQRLDD